MAIDTSGTSVRDEGRTASPVRPSVGRNGGPLDLRLATTPIERDAVFRFRHRILGRRLGEDLGFTCSNGRLLESLDVGSDLLAAFGRGERVHAVVRIEEFQAARIRRGYPLVAMQGDRGSEIESASFSSRLLVDPDADAHLTVRLLASLVGIAVRRGFHRDYCASSSVDDGARIRLGYRPSNPSLESGFAGRFLELRLPSDRNEKSDLAPPRSSRWRGLRRLGGARP